MQGRSRSILAFALVAALSLQASIAPGYMPASIARGQVMALCPGGLPMAWRMALFGQHHDHGGAHAEVAGECAFAATALASPPSAVTLGVAALPPAVYAPGLRTLQPTVRRVVAFSPRAPPVPN